MKPSDYGVVGIDQYRDIFFRPDIIEARLRGEDKD